MPAFQLLGSENQKPVLVVTSPTGEVHPESGGWLANFTIQGASGISTHISLRPLTQRVVQSLRVRRTRELEWRRTHKETLRQYLGQWVALEGDQITAHGLSLADVVTEARARGVRVPYVFRVEDLG